jgi:hypothetical protein
VNLPAWALTIQTKWAVMPRKLCESLFAFAAFSALAACTSSAPQSASAPPERASAPAAATAPVESDALKRDARYRRVTKNGEEYFCRREPVTGTLTKKVETCLTEAQMEGRSRAEQDELRRTQGVPIPPAGAGAAGATGR